MGVLGWAWQSGAMQRERDEQWDEMSGVLPTAPKAQLGSAGSHQHGQGLRGAKHAPLKGWKWSQASSPANNHLLSFLQRRLSPIPIPSPSYPIPSH